MIAKLSLQSLMFSLSIVGCGFNFWAVIPAIALSIRLILTDEE